MTDRLKHIGDKAHEAITRDDVVWMLDEIERLRNLKGVLMTLGNRLVTEHGWLPASGKWWDRVPAGKHTGLIAALTKQINENEEMRCVLDDLYEASSIWRMSNDR